MRTPVTKLNEEYSSPGATATGWQETCGVLEAAQLFWISTVRADGRPHVTPVVAVWAGDALWFTTGRNEQKFLNLQSHPHVVMTTGCNTWDGGLDVVVEGQAVQVTDDAVLEPIALVFNRKWDGEHWRYKAQGGAFRDLDDGSGEALVFSVTPTKVFAHSKGEPFGATRHRF
jgi:general stress protein 26